MDHNDVTFYVAGALFYAVLDLIPGIFEIRRMKREARNEHFIVRSDRPLPLSAFQTAQHNKQ